MNVRKFKSDKDALIAEGNRIVSSSDDAKFIRKVTIVNLLLRGMSAKLVADACGETDRTLSNWVRIVDEYGFGALCPKKQPGRPQCLTELQKENIKVAVASDPASFGYTVWDGPSLSGYIALQYGIPLCVRQCQRLLHELGFSLIRPQTFPSKGSEESPLRDKFKKLTDLENDPDAVICYQDEVHFMAESTVTRAWYPKGSSPKVKSYPGHKSVAYSGFVVPETGELFTIKQDWFNYETTITCIGEFLALHPAGDGKHLYFVMDNAP